MPIVIRRLDPIADLAAVAEACAEAADYWTLVDGKPPDATKAAAFFTDGPPGCDPALSHRLGLFVKDRLSGVAELSFGFPALGDAYLGALILAPQARRQGFGRHVLAHVENLARTAGAPHLYLAVLAANTKGRAFWDREGFRPTGKSSHDAATGHTLHRLVKPL